MSKVAIITAASKGMGAACARALAAEGYKVSLLARSEQVHKLADELGGIAIQGNVTNKDDLKKLVNSTIGTYGRIDAVVNNTGHPAKGELLELDEQAWHNGLNLVLLNVIKMARLVTPVMEKQGGGSFVNISTFAAFEPSLDFPISSSLRAALASFTKMFADQYASKGIRMNNVLPGFINSYPVNASKIGEIPMDRPGKTSEVADAVAFLLSDKASYITGQNLRVDGGITRSV